MARQKKKKSLLQVFRKYNRKYFDNKFKISSLKFAKMPYHTVGETTFYDVGLPSIKINQSLTNWGRHIRLVLLHETAHVSLPFDVGHGPRFIRRLHRLVKQGAYDDLL